MSQPMDPRLQSSSPEAQLQHYAQTAIPTAMLDLGSKHQYVNQVIQYCEQSYMVQNKDEIERQTKNYLTDALEAVVKDIELIAANLTQYVDLQANCVDSLTSQLDMVRTRMELAREHQAYNRLNQMRRERNQPPVTKTISKSPAVHYLQGDELPAQAKKMPAYNRVPLGQRLAGLDSVGICLSKEEAARTDFSGYSMKNFSTASAPSPLAPPTLTHTQSTSSQGSTTSPPPQSPGRPMPPVPAPAAAAPLPPPTMPAPTPMPGPSVPPPAAAPPMPMPMPPAPQAGAMPPPPMPPAPMPPAPPVAAMPPPPSMPPATGAPPPPRPPMPPGPPGPPGGAMPPPPGPPPPGPPPPPRM